MTRLALLSLLWALGSCNGFCGTPFAAIPEGTFRFGAGDTDDEELEFPALIRTVTVIINPTDVAVYVEAKDGSAAATFFTRPETPAELSEN